MPIKRNFSNIALIVVAIIVMGSGISAGIYLLQQNKELAVACDAKRNELEEIKSKLAAVPDLEKADAEMKAELKRMTTFIPNREGQAEFIKELQSMAAQSNIKIKSCTIKPELVRLQELPDYDIYNWSLSINSKYDSLLKFIDSLPNASRFIVVSNMSMKKLNDEKKAQDELEVTLSLDLITKPTTEKVKP